MKIINSIFLASCFFAGTFFVGCNSAATVFANRSVLHISTPKLLGERAYVTGSPTSSDSTVNAEKKVEQETKANVAQNLNDNSSNYQKTSQPSTEKPVEEKSTEDIKK